ncbi:AAA family ATPase [Janibacter sp. GS2]|uniref:AAA family ATPase n=1 Tax=Janibacter sp. GS2 TaxID=3442646 RepID=UPI003EBFB636
MRLHRLTATAFGPFADEVDLDLEAISTAGLFLIHGPTGSGKTSLLDAICFALYANVPGDRQSTTLRSHHAAPAQPTVVTLELTLAGRRLHLTRSPAHERPKRRGTGTTTEQARVQLEEFVDGGWTTLSSRVDETARILDDLLGMALDQFRRVVMLPQGDFAAFLRASDEERREVLERLFDVTDFVAVEQHLVERRQQAQTLLTGLRSGLAGHTLRLEELLAETDAPLPELETPLGELATDELLAAVRDIDTTLETRASEVMAFVDRAQRRASAARSALDSGKRSEELRRRGTRAQTTLDQLAEAADEHAATRRGLARARDAATVLPHVEALRRARRAVSTAEAAHDAAVAALPRAPQDADLVELRDQLARDDEGLGVARHEVDALARMRAEVPPAAALVSERSAGIESASSALATARERADEVRGARQDVAAAQDRLGVITPLLTLVSALSTARSRVDEAEAEARRTTDARQAAQQQSLDLRERVQQLVQQRLDTMAGELASQLTDGEACSVCGALEHPAPARASGQVSPDQIDAASAEATAAEATLDRTRAVDESAASRLELARARVTDLESQLRGDASPLGAELVASADLSAGLAQLSSEREALVAVTDRHESVEQALSASEAGVTQAETALGEAETALAEATARRDRLTEEIGAGTTRLAEAITAHDDGCACRELLDAPSPSWGPHAVDTVLEEAVRRHRVVLEAVRTITTSGDALERTTTTRDEVVELLDRALTERDFEDAEAVEAAALDRRVMADLEDRVAEHERRLASAESVLEEPDVVAALADDPVDLTALRTAADRTRHEADLVGRRQASAQTVLRQFTAVRDHIDRSCAELGPALEEAELVTRMSALVTGTSTDNDKRMRLSTYVLAARLERIVELANERLLDMADGRYELGHHDAAGRGRRRGGLGLLVRDLWTGQERPTETLSGGESFTASLALALGLADAIREESGGQEFGILFVDEGFGSLDQDSLEQVLDMLDRLRDGGRTVGVVSHVTEMRTRIPTQVRIDKTPHGSSVQVLGDLAVDVA